MSIIPRSTRGRSVHRSSSAERFPDGKSPYMLSSPAKVEVPRLWYIVGSFSQFGVFAVRSASSWKTGVYGNDDRSTSGKPWVPSA